MYRHSRGVFLSVLSRGSRQTAKRPIGRGLFEQLESRTLLAADPWQNAANPLDVNGDGHVTPIDALTIINELNKSGSHVLTTLASDFSSPAPVSTVTAGPQVATLSVPVVTSVVSANTPAAVNTAGDFVDVNGDGSISPIDALDIINALATTGGPSVVVSDNLGGTSPSPSSQAKNALIAPGHAITYTVSFGNTGPGENFALADPLPSLLSGVTYTATETGNATGFTASGSGNINDTSVVLPSNSTVTYTVTGTLAAGATAAQITNTATATPFGGTAITATDVDEIHTVHVTLEATNASGTVLTTIPVGSTFQIRALVEDISADTTTGATASTNTGGLFDAYIDTTYNSALASIPSDANGNAVATFGTTYTSVEMENTETPGLVTDTGAISNTFTNAVGPGQFFLWSIPVTAVAAGNETFTPSEGGSGDEISVYGVDAPVNPAEISFDSASIQVTGGAATTDLSITKTDNVGGSSMSGAIGTATPGSSLTYSVVVTNGGATTVTGATVADTMPAGIASDNWTATQTGGASGFSAAGSGSIDDTAVSLPAGSTVTYTITANVGSAATAQLVNTATVAAPAGTTDTNLTNNSATDKDNLVPSADLSISKTDNVGGSSTSGAVGSASPGGSLTYTIIVANHGPSSVSGAAVADTMPAGLASDTWTATTSGGATGFSASGTGNINNPAVNLPSGSTVTYTVVATVSATTSTQLNNTATVTAPVGTDPNLANNSATDLDNVVPTADLSITKVDDHGGSSIHGTTGNVSSGAPLTYTIIVTNSGPLAANGATVSDVMSTGLASDTWTATSTGGAIGYTASGSGNIDDTAVNLPSGSTVTYTVAATVGATTMGLLSNSASVTTPAGLTDPNLANNSATDKDNVVPTTDLSITKMDSSGGSSSTGATGTANAGQTTTYTIVVTNNGPTAANGATVLDMMPAGLSSDTWSAVGSGGASGYTPSGTGNIDDTAVDLPTSSTVTYTVVGTVATTFAGTLVNTATVTPPAGVADSNTANNSATDNETVPGFADLSITKIDNAGGSSVTSTTGTVIPGTQVVYTIVATNNGPSSITGVGIADLLPAAISSDTYTASETGGASTFTASGSGNINDTAVTMPSGSTVTYVVTALVNPTATINLSNTATITAPAGVTDTALDNNSATDSDTLTPTADLSITKVDNEGGSSITGTTGNVVKGQTFTYTIVVTNNGPSQASGASVVDTLPTVMSGDTFTASETGGATGFTTSGSGNIDDTAVILPAGSTVTYTVVATVSATATPGLINNVATVTAPGGVADPTPGNNTATDADNVLQFTASSLSGNEFIDGNGNGTHDSNELEVMNATIQLTGNDVLGNSIDLTTTTAADGSYSFTNLNPGTYTLTSVQSPSLTAGQAIPGTEGGTATDANDLAITIGPAGGITGTGNNFTEKGVSSALISERLVLASNSLNGHIDLDDSAIFGTGTPEVVVQPAPSVVPASSLLLASNAGGSSATTQSVDSAFADPQLTADSLTELGFATAPQPSSSINDQVFSSWAT